MSESGGGSRRGRVIAVVGASGGAGATTLVAALGHLSARGGRSCVVVDLHPGGPGLDVPYAVEHVAGIRWPALAAVDGEVDGAALVSRLPAWRGVRVLAQAREPGPVPGEAAAAEILDGLAAQVDVLVLDVPRAVPAWVTCRVGTAVVLAGTGVLELAALAATARRVAAEVDEAFVVLRGRRVAPDLGDDVSRALDLPVLGWLRDDPGVSRSLTRGRGPLPSGPVAETAGMILRVAVGEPQPVAS